MKSLLSLLFFLLLTLATWGKGLYLKTFGSPENPAFLFLHGGPGYNCANFEGTTAQKLADQGFFVVAYDRRGEGRSSDPKAAYTFEETFSDIKWIFKKFGIKKANLIGHSFGGIVGTLFAVQNPSMTASLTLVGAPISLQESFQTILTTSKAIYSAKNDTANLHYISILETMDRTSLAFSSYCFMHALQNGFYSPKDPTEESLALRAGFKADSVLFKWANLMTQPPAQGFWKNEAYTTMDLNPSISSLLSARIPVHGLYGKNDGLYSEAQVSSLSQRIGLENVLHLERCGHNVFIDQQAQFLAAMKKWGTP